mmetsp:Transcript_13172/g.28500  ORF Transcript_13172/g.28500 Transcript_13172/m.28500 type:complete len:246 (-) Transcript_13172:713-1450(-)
MNMMEVEGRILFWIDTLCMALFFSRAPPLQVATRHQSPFLLRQQRLHIVRFQLHLPLPSTRRRHVVREQVHAHQDHRRPETELRAQRRAEEERGSERPRRDAHPRRHPLEHVVRVLDHCRHEHPSPCLEGDDHPRPHRESVHERLDHRVSVPVHLSGDPSLPRLAPHVDQGNAHREERHLDVAHPHGHGGSAASAVGGGTLEHLLEVDASEGRAEARHRDRAESHEEVLGVGGVDLLLPRLFFLG